MFVLNFVFKMKMFVVGIVFFVMVFGVVMVVDKNDDFICVFMNYVCVLKFDCVVVKVIIGNLDVVDVMVVDLKMIVFIGCSFGIINFVLFDIIGNVILDECVFVFIDEGNMVCVFC